MKKGQLLEAILEQQKAVHKDGWNVTTSQRHDVPTSRRPHVVTSQRRNIGSTNIKVNNMQRRDASTSRRLNVATSQRHDVATSRRQCEFCLLIIKSKKGCRFGGIGNRMNQGAEIRAAVTSISKKSP